MYTPSNRRWCRIVGGEDFHYPLKIKIQKINVGRTTLPEESMGFKGRSRADSVPIESHYILIRVLMNIEMLSDEYRDFLSGSHGFYCASEISFFPEATRSNSAFFFLAEQTRNFSSI